MLFEDVLRRLTPTERRVVEYFASNGGSAREIAGALGISERTVYKALYRYRRIAESLGYDASEFYFRRKGSMPAAARAVGAARHGGGSSCGEEVVRLLRRILSELEEINAKLDALSGSGPRVGPVERPRVAAEVEEGGRGGEGLPSFASGNPWLRVLSDRR